MKKPGNKGHSADEDLSLWQTVTKGFRAYGCAKKAPAPAAPLARAAARKNDLPPPAPALVPGDGFDRSTRGKLTRGQLRLEGTLDLHGMTQQEAFTALHNFIPSAASRGKRTLLVITGQGRAGQGVLRRLLPQWLEGRDLAPYVLAVAPAQQKDGGAGAFYIRLRKKREK